MRIGKRTNTVMLCLWIKILDAKCINIFSAQLYTPFVAPPSIVSPYFIPYQLIERQLSVYLAALRKIAFEIKTGCSIIKAFVLLFNGAIKYNWVQVSKFKMVALPKDHPFKQTEIQPFGDCNVKVVHSRIFFRHQFVATRNFG